jgi:FkbM family methyltransferase
MYLLYCSLKLDLRFLFKFPLWHIYDKIDVIAKKYFLVLKYVFNGFNYGTDAISIKNRVIYPESKYGLTLLEGILVRHYNLIKGANITDAQTIIDIGANNGYFTVLARDMFPTAQIFTIEPIPDVFSSLSKTFQSDKNVTLAQLAISNTSGQAKMEFDTQNTAVSKLTDSGNLTVKTQTLDLFIQNHSLKKIDLLKIDVESHELEVLQGATNTLEKTKYIIIEITLENSPYTISSLLKLLSTDNYDFQLRAVINYPHISEGRISMLDYLLENIKL